MCNGTAYQLPPLVPDIAEIGSGYWLPTPTARDWKDTPGMAQRSGDRNRTDQLPRRIYALEQSPARGGILNPEFSLWLMGFPAGWLDIDFTPSETRSFRQSRASSCGRSQQRSGAHD